MKRRSSSSAAPVSNTPRAKTVCANDPRPVVDEQNATIVIGDLLVAIDALDDGRSVMKIARRERGELFRAIEAVLLGEAELIALHAMLERRIVAARTVRTSEPGEGT